MKFPHLPALCQIFSSALSFVVPRSSPSPSAPFAGRVKGERPRGLKNGRKREKLLWQGARAPPVRGAPEAMQVFHRRHTVESALSQLAKVVLEA